MDQNESNYFRSAFCLMHSIPEHYASEVVADFSDTVTWKKIDEIVLRLNSFAPLLDGLKYARRFLHPDEHDTEYIDNILAKAEPTEPTITADKASAREAE